MRSILLSPIVVVALLSPAQAQVRLPNARPIAVDAPEALVGHAEVAPVPSGSRPAALNNTPPSSVVRIGRRSGSQRVDFLLTHPKKTYGNAHYEVFADVGVNINTGAPLLMNKVLSGPVGQAVDGLVFRVDFAPLLRRTTSSGPVFNLDLVERLNQQGRLRLYVRVQPDPIGAVSPGVERRLVRPAAGGRPAARPRSGPGRMFRPAQAPSAYAVVDIGEPQPPALDTAVEADAPSAGSAAWGSTARLDQTTQIRWHTQATSAARFIAQVNQTGFSQGWETWAITGAGGQELAAKPSGPIDTKVFRASDLFFSFPQPAITDRDYYVRIVPLDAAGNLAGMPSNVVQLTVPLYTFGGGQTAPPPAPAVHLALERVEYRSENAQVDDTRFVVARDVPSNALEYGIFAALAGQPPKQGVKLQIVPQTDDESMWDAIAGALGGVLGDAFAYAAKVKDFVDTVVSVLQSIVGVIVGIGDAALDKGLVFALKASGMPDAYIDKYEVLRRTPGYVAGSALAVESQAHEMTAGQARNAFFKVLNSLTTKQSQMHALPEVSPYLAQDPDYQYRPPTMFVTFRAIADKGAEGRLSSATSFSVSCINFWKDASYQLSNGQALTGQTLVIDSVVQVPPTPEGAEIVVPIYLTFGSAQAQSDPNWGRAWFSPSSSTWQIWGKTLDGSTTSSWTRSF